MAQVVQEELETQVVQVVQVVPVVQENLVVPVVPVVQVALVVQSKDNFSFTYFKIIYGSNKIN
mgnify:CR=1 FL=1